MSRSKYFTYLLNPYQIALCLVIIAGGITCWKYCAKKETPLLIQPRDVPSCYDYLAPDGSEMSRLQTKENTSRGDMAYCKLLPGKTSSAVKHKTVEELWYITSGTGEIWLKEENQVGRIFNIKKGTSLAIPVRTSFQFRNTSATEALEIVMTTMPPWPGADEAILVQGQW